jgi:hypothetical protein
MVGSDAMVGSGGGVMNDQMFDIYRKASESWFKLQQELFAGLYKSAILLFQQTSQAPATQPSKDHPAISGANGSKEKKTTPHPGSEKSRHSRKAAGKRPERPGVRSR